MLPVKLESKKYWYFVRYQRIFVLTMKGVVFFCQTTKNSITITICIIFHYMYWLLAYKWNIPFARKGRNDFLFNSIFYWKEHNRGVIQTTNIQLQYIINILEINKHKDWIIENNLQQGGRVYLKLVVCTCK